jgi:hypothetical protein
MPKVIVKFLNGTERSGSVLAFNVNLPTFPLNVMDDKGTPAILKVNINSVKAIYFPKAGEPGIQVRTETLDQSVYSGGFGFKLVVEFNDGEVINGTSQKYSPNDKGYFLVPMNPSDRNERIYINAKAVKHVDSRRLLGKVLIDQEKIDTMQLNTALRYQCEKREKKLGTILREEKMITEEQLQKSLRIQERSAKMLGEILIDASYITPNQLEYALEIQHENRKKRLGQILVELKYVTPNDICIAVASQFHLPWVDLSNVEIPRELASVLPEKVMREYGVIPIERKENDILVVATSQPQYSDIWLEVRKSTIMKVELVVAYEGYIEAAIDYHFPPKQSMCRK